MAGLTERAKALNDQSRALMQSAVAGFVPLHVRTLINHLTALVLDMAQELEARGDGK